MQVFGSHWALLSDPCRMSYPEKKTPSESDHRFYTKGDGRNLNFHESIPRHGVGGCWSARAWRPWISESDRVEDICRLSEKEYRYWKPMSKIICWLSCVAALDWSCWAQRVGIFVSDLSSVIHHIIIHFSIYGNQFHETRIESVAGISSWLLRLPEPVDNKGIFATTVRGRLYYLCRLYSNFVGLRGLR